ncbi:MAG: hypothetical protein ABEJ89_00775 [Haloarculaceae archaeon]
MARGQAYTLEGVIGAIVIVLAVGYGVQAIDTGPWSGSGPGATTLDQRAEDVLATGVDTGALSDVVRCYGPNKRVIDGDYDVASNSEFEAMLNRTFDAQGENYNLYIAYWNESGQREQRLVSANDTAFPEPGPNAETATVRFALYDDQPIRFGAGRDCSIDGPRLDSVNDFYVPDVNESSQVYNVVEVRLVVW